MENSQETTSPPSEADSSVGSSATEPELEQRALQCPYCDFRGNSERGLSVHVARKHPEMKGVAWDDRPRRVAPPPPPPPAVENAEAKPSQVPDLAQLEQETAQNIAALGQLLHAALFMAKTHRVAQGKPPAIDTHLAFALQLRAGMSAKVLCEYAARNPTVMRVLQGFNAALRGGDAGVVVGSIALAGLATLGRPAPMPVTGMFIPDVLAAVDRENQELMAQFQAAAAAREAA